MGEYIQSRRLYFKKLSNTCTEISVTIKEKKILTNTNDFILLIFSFDMVVDENTNNTNSQEIQSATEDDDSLYTIAGKLVVTASNVAEVVAL